MHNCTYWPQKWKNLAAAFITLGLLEYITHTQYRYPMYFGLVFSNPIAERSCGKSDLHPRDYDIMVIARNQIDKLFFCWLLHIFEFRLEMRFRAEPSLKLKWSF